MDRDRKSDGIKVPTWFKALLIKCLVRRGSEAWQTPPESHDRSDHDQQWDRLQSPHRICNEKDTTSILQYF